MNAATGATGTMPSMHGSPPHPGYPHPEGGGASLLQQQYDMGASIQNPAAGNGAIGGMQSHTFAQSTPSHLAMAHQFLGHGTPCTHPGPAPLQPGTMPHQGSPLHPGSPHGGDLGASSGQQHGMGSPNQWQIAAHPEALAGHKLSHSMSVPGPLPGQFIPQMHEAGDMRRMSFPGQPSGHGTPMHGATHFEALAEHMPSHSMSLPGHGTPQDSGALANGWAMASPQGGRPQPGYFGASAGQTPQSKTFAHWHHGMPPPSEDSESEAGNRDIAPVPQHSPAYAATTPLGMPLQPEAQFRQCPGQTPHGVPSLPTIPAATACEAPPNQLSPHHDVPPQQAPGTMTALPQQAPHQAFSFKNVGHGQASAPHQTSSAEAFAAPPQEPFTSAPPLQALECTPHPSPQQDAPAQQAPEIKPAPSQEAPQQACSKNNGQASAPHAQASAPHQLSPQQNAPAQQAPEINPAPPQQASQQALHASAANAQAFAAAPPPQQPATSEAHKQLPSMPQTGALSQHSTTHSAEVPCKQSFVPADGEPPQHLPSPATSGMSAPASATPQHQPVTGVAVAQPLASVTPDSQKAVSPAAVSPQQPSFQPVMQLD